MFNRNKFTDDDFRDIERYEEYQRRKNEAIVKGAGNFLLRILCYWFIFIGTCVVLALAISFIFDIQEGIATIISFILSFFVFKINYVKEYPFKSVLISWFILFLEAVAFGGIKL